MSSALARIARALAHHWKRSLVAALVILVGLGAVAGTFGGMPTEDFEIPGTESQQALELFRAHAPALAGSEANVVVSAEVGAITDPANRRAVEAAFAQVRTLPGVTEVGDPLAAVSPDGRVALVDVRYSTPPMELGDEGALLESTLRERLEPAGVGVDMRGIVIDAAGEQEVPVGELIGVALAVILLTLLFRSVAAMIATIVGALIGVMFGQMLLQTLATPLGLPEFATIIAVMLGLGVGIDYALLIIGRYREQIAAGDPVPTAAGRSLATAGSSVVAAGLIVMVAIAGLLAIGIPLVGQMGIGAAIGVAAVVISSLTILPIMMGMLSKRLRPKRPEHVLPSAAFARWGAAVSGRPWLSAGIVGAVMVLLAIPALGMTLGQPDDGNQPAAKTQRQAYDTVAAAFGPGANGPLLIAVATPDGTAAVGDDLQRLAGALAGTDGVALVTPPVPSQDDQLAILSVIPTTSPQDTRTADLVDTLRGEVIPAATAGTGLDPYVGGATATFMDFSEKVSERLPLFIALVVALSVLLLMAAFRSVWIPLASAVLNVLSICAAYGIIVLVFQEGWGAGLVGAEAGVPIVSFIPLMLFAILFGLSMDYNVFLLSRIREAYMGGDAPRDAVVHGVARIGKVVLFAALIMASVFLAFVVMPDVMVKMLGLGLGLAILIDVILVRLIIMPAIVTLLGDRAWWMPRWLDRVLPNISLDGHEPGSESDEDLEQRILHGGPRPQGETG